MIKVKEQPKEYPVLQAFERNQYGHLSVWCPYCKIFHNHGAGEGHRIAHCNSDSPFKETGYIIKKIVYKETKSR